MLPTPARGELPLWEDLGAVSGEAWDSKDARGKYLQELEPDFSATPLPTRPDKMVGDASILSRSFYGAGSR